jgi:integrase
MVASDANVGFRTYRCFYRFLLSSGTHQARQPSNPQKVLRVFYGPIRNANTRAAYYRAIQQFLSWVEHAGYQDLEDIEPITVAAYIETLQRNAAPPTVKQHMAAIRMLFSWLTEKGGLAMNPAREVKIQRFPRTEGKTPAFVDGEVQQLLDAIEKSTHTGLRDRALLGALAYTFRPDRCRRDSEVPRLLSVWETVFSPI